MFYSYVLYSRVFCVAYSYIVENIENFALKNAIKRRPQVLRTSSESEKCRT